LDHSALVILSSFFFEILTEAAKCAFGLIRFQPFLFRIRQVQDQLDISKLSSQVGLSFGQDHTCLLDKIPQLYTHSYMNAIQCLQCCPLTSCTIILYETRVFCFLGVIHQ
jgi:hypothetical protein